MRLETKRERMDVQDLRGEVRKRRGKRTVISKPRTHIGL
jgi:hypothetical protein